MFRERLRNARENLNISQKQMADMLGIAVTTYRNYENTSREPNYDILVNIANVLGVSIDYLLGNYSSCDYIDIILKKCSKLDEQSKKELDIFIDYLIHRKNKR